MTAKRIILSGLLFLLVAAVAYMYVPWNTFSTRRPSDTPALVADEESLDFGEAWERADLLRAIRLTNTTDHSIELVDIRANCSCTQILKPTLTIPAGETAELPLSIDLTLDTTTSSEVRRPFEVIITAKDSEDDTPPYSWTVTGQIKSFLIIAIREVFIGQQDADKQFEPRAFDVWVKNPDVKLVAWCHRDFGIAAAIPDAVDKAKYRIQIDTRRRLQIGTFRFPLSIQGMLPSGEKTNIITIPVVGKVTGDIEFVPDSLIFLPIAIGMQRSKTVRLSSRSGTSFSIELIEAADANITAVAQSNKAQTEHTLNINLRVTEAGEHNNELIVIVRDTQKEQAIKYQIPVTWIGLDKTP